MIKIKIKPGRVLWVVMSILVIVGVGVALRRELYLTRLLDPVVNPKFGAFDATINEKAQLTWLHIVPGTLYLLLAPLQFMTRFRARHLRLHRLIGRICVCLGLVVGVTALLMSFLTPIGGLNETVATMLFAFFFLFSLLKAYRYILRREITLHREWMLRAFTIALAIATVRLIVGMFFAFSNLSPREFFGIAFWLGFTLHLITAEVWINYIRQQKLG